GRRRSSLGRRCRRCDRGRHGDRRLGRCGRRRHGGGRRGSHLGGRRRGGAGELLQLLDVLRQLGHARGGVFLLAFLRQLVFGRRGLAGGGALAERQLVGRRRGGQLLVFDVGLHLAAGLPRRGLALRLGDTARELLAVGAEVGALRLDHFTRFRRRDALRRIGTRNRQHDA